MIRLFDRCWFKMTNLKWDTVLHEMISKTVSDRKRKGENWLNSSMADVEDAFRRRGGG
jgi:hypothetical protein